VLGGSIEAESGAGETRLILHCPRCAPALTDGQGA
jgi:hypothetical protein